MIALEIKNCEIGTVSSRQDHSVAFRVITPELRPSESGAIMQWHGKACTVSITPHDGPPEELLKVDTERESKSPSERMHSILFVEWKQKDPTAKESFSSYYPRRMDQICERLKSALNPT